MREARKEAENPNSSWIIFSSNFIFLHFGCRKNVLHLPLLLRWLFYLVTMCVAWKRIKLTAWVWKVIKSECKAVLETTFKQLQSWIYRNFHYLEMVNLEKSLFFVFHVLRTFVKSYKIFSDKKPLINYFMNAFKRVRERRNLWNARDHKTSYLLHFIHKQYINRSVEVFHFLMRIKFGVKHFQSPANPFTCTLVLMDNRIPTCVEANIDIQKEMRNEPHGKIRAKCNNGLKTI